MRNNLIPSVLDNILIPFSLAEMAKREPSLLKRMRGLAWEVRKDKIEQIITFDLMCFHLFFL